MGTERALFSEMASNPEEDRDATGQDSSYRAGRPARSDRFRAASPGATPLFLGIGPTDRVSQYLSNVVHDEVTDFGWWSAAVKYRHLDGGAPSSPPGQQDFWVAKQEGPGSQTLEGDIQDGNWTAVVMNG